LSTEDGPKKGQIELLHYRIEPNKEKELLINGRKCTVEGLIKAAYVDDGIAPLQKVFSLVFLFLTTLFFRSFVSSLNVFICGFELLQPNLELVDATLDLFQKPYNEQPWFHGDLTFLDAFSKLGT
jgi:hypothetical protein